ncbi:MAG: hypothetical protein U5J83_16410, partial [Bryobacterales bacterium]|nr:hypothetical protein [Bryobacterales bacterium]
MTASMLPRGRILLAAALLAAAAVVPYIPFLPLPPISDDYMQIGLAREFVSMEGLPQLAAHPLYRTRATSLVFTRLVEAASGEEIATSIFVHRLAGVLLHLANGLLIFAAGVWPRLGYRRSFAAALAFLLLADHQEAVVWVAAVHELLVFAFSILCLIAWAQWLRVRGTGWLLLTALAFVLALYSKESAAVLPALMALIWTLEADRRYANLLPIALALLGALAYTYFVFGASREHQHLNDGTFSLAAPFLQTLLRTTWRLFWPWGVVAAALLYRQRHARPLLAALACSALALL